MSSKTIGIISGVLLTALVGSASAVTYTWDKGGTTKLWNVAANWNPDGVPTASDSAQINLADANCVIDATVTALCTAVTVGGTAGGNSYLDMTGGTLTCTTGSTSNSLIVGVGGTFILSGGLASAPGGRLQVGTGGKATLIVRGGELYAYDKIQIGTNSAGDGTVYMQSGVLNLGMTPTGNSTDLELSGGGGKSLLQMTGGTINLYDTIKLAQGANGVARLNLYGGTISANSLLAVASVTGQPTIDITKGTLIFRTDRTTLVNDYISRGWIVAYNGTGEVIVTLTGGQTIVTGYKADENLARDPSPADAGPAQRTTSLSWTPGIYAATHDVYFGTVFADVNAATRDNPLGVLVSKNQTAGTYTPAQVEWGQTYYWRVDEVNATPDTTIYKGAVWSFTVEALATALTNITATASSSLTGADPATTINGAGLTGDLHATDAAGMWGTAPTDKGPIWIKYDFGQLYKLHEMWVWNYNSEFEYLLGFGMKNVTVEYSADGTTWTTLGNFEFAQAPGTPDYAHSTTVSFGGAVAKMVKLTATSNYGGASTGLSEVRFLSIPVTARQPQPANAATGVDTGATLTWWAGREAVSHQVYVGTDAAALTLAGTLTSTSYAGSWNVGTTYYWRVDEVNAAAPVPTWTGTVWNFTTVGYFVVDDIESYNDDTNPIFGTWIDGYNTTTNGCQVGNDGTPYASTSPTHGGKYSMPLRYTNENGKTNSEAVRTFATAQDWTHNGIGSLSLYFYGTTTNVTTVPFFITLTDANGKSAKVVYGAGAGEDVTKIATAAWTQWSIKLSSFTGVTASKIKSMTIGFGAGTGSGQMYIDDIWLTK